jgi:hypothetical protein
LSKKASTIHQDLDGSVYFHTEPQLVRPSAKELVALLALIGLLLLTLAIVEASPARAQELATGNGLKETIQLRR